MKKILRLLGTICAIGLLIGGFHKSMVSYALTEEEEIWVQEARTQLQQRLDAKPGHEIMALVYLSDEYAVREQPSQDASVVVNVPSGQLVMIRDAAVDDEYNIWSEVDFYVGETRYQGYILRQYLACSDELLLNWEAEYGLGPAGVASYALEGETSAYPDIEQFPESYQSALIALKEKHPGWTFVKMNTQLKWEDVIAGEIGGGKSLVHKSLPAYTKEGLYDNGSWYYASEDILKYYMDPRNFLAEDTIFAFEQLTYNETYHTEAAVEAFLNNTFMNSSKWAPGTEMTFARIIWAIGAEEGRRVSPFHLAARIYQEQGNGTSHLISGTYPGYEGYYNYFNVRASGTTDKEVIENGLKYAKEQNWNSAYYSILGGADVISANYIKRGQDTLYLQKYNVNPNGYYALYTHQYMQNISAPFTESKSIKKLYENAGSLDNTFVFKIPVYENMPESASPYPTASTNVVLKLPEGYKDNTVWVDGVAYGTAARNGRVIATVPDGTGKTAVVYKYNENKVPVGMYVWTLEYADNAYKVTEQPELENLLTYHGFSIRITGKSGIRFKTGISQQLKDKLINGGVNGYRLSEYGTLIMDNAKRPALPMIKGGEKVLEAMSYGIEENGAFIDKVFESIDGRARYTCVLVGVPVEYYKTEYAFRGYINLKKDDQIITLYGPAVAKSIYGLADQLLKSGSYEEGSDVALFLQKLMQDADAVQNVQEPENNGNEQTGNSGEDQVTENGTENI